MDLSKIDPTKAGGWAAAIVGLGTALYAPFRIFPTKGWIKAIEIRLGKVEEKLDNVSVNYMTKDEMNAMEQRLQTTLAANQEETRRTAYKAFENLDNFIQTVQLLKEMKPPKLMDPQKSADLDTPDAT